MPDQSELVSSARRPQSRVVQSASGMVDAAQAPAPPKDANELLRQTLFMAERQARLDPTVV